MIWRRVHVQKLPVAQVVTIFLLFYFKIHFHTVAFQKVIYYHLSCTVIYNIFSLAIYPTCFDIYNVIFRCIYIYVRD
jgi:hypothetical protein